MNLDKIRKDLEFLEDYETIIFGSCVIGDFREDSDIDIGVISRLKDPKENIDLLKSFMGGARAVYDIRIFELLSLKLKASVMSDYQVLFGNELEISEYLYYYRKLWDDQKHRIIGGYFKNYKEKIKAINSGL